MAITTDNRAKTLFGKRKEQLRELEANAERATAFEREVASLRDDVAKLQRKRAGVAALGDEPYVIRQQHFEPKFGLGIEMEVARSVLTGRELAANVDARLADLEREIAWREREIADLLKGAQRKV